MDIFYEKELKILTDYFLEWNLSKIILDYIGHKHINPKFFSILNFNKKDKPTYYSQFNLGPDTINEIKLKCVIYISDFCNPSPELINLIFCCCESISQYIKYFNMITNDSKKIIFCMENSTSSELLLYSIDKNLGIFIEKYDYDTNIKCNYKAYLFNFDISNDNNNDDIFIEGKICEINNLECPKYFKNKYIFIHKSLKIEEKSPKLLSIICVC
jgi:hypothetical protein